MSSAPEITDAAPPPPASAEIPLAGDKQAAAEYSGTSIMPDLLLLGLVACLALAALVTAARQWQHRRACGRLANEFTAAARAFDTYIRVSGKTPPDAAIGHLPSGVAAFLTGADWTAPTPAGGSYRWTKAPADQTPGGVAGQISLVAFPPGPAFKLSPADLLAIDRRIDDGNLATGDFRTGFNGWPVFTVRTQP